MSQNSPVHVKESISTETDTHKITLNKLASYRAKNYLLKQRITECKVTMQYLEQKVATIADKHLEILGEVMKLRKNVASAVEPPEIQTLDASTSTIQVSSPPLEQYDLSRNRGPAWSILYSIKEENEQEESQENELDQADAQPLSQIPQLRLEDTLADESDI